MTRAPATRAEQHRLQRTRLVVIVGASRGIGHALARDFASHPEVHMHVPSAHALCTDHK